MFELKTKRLRLVPLTDEALAERLAQTSDAQQRAIYETMLANCRAQPADRLWYTCWSIRLKDGGEEVGRFSFKGPPNELGEVEIAYRIDPPHRGVGYATEAAYDAVNWAFARPEAYYVLAEADERNAASIGVLSHLGFTAAGWGREGRIFEKEKPIEPLLTVYMCIGLSLGLCLGSAMDNIAVGMSIGLCIGLAIGAGLDTRSRKQLEALRARRKKAD